jgi:hypothetical protein
MQQQSYKISMMFAAAMLLAAPARAAVPDFTPLNLTAHYTVAWNGIPIGRINMTASEDALGYRMVVDTKTHGLAALFNDVRSVTQAEGHKEGASYIPRRYDIRPQGNDDIRHTTVTYDAQGQIATRERAPAEDPSWRPVVPLVDADAATDPITASFAARGKLHDAMAQNNREMTLKTYDGARLAEMHFTVVSPARVEVMGEYVDAINTIVARQPIAGYTPKEIKKYKKGDPTIHLYFSADAKFIPLRATVDTVCGELSATLVGVE